MLELSLPQKIAIWFLPILFAITLHEVAHGWIAFRRGDKTAFLAGRLTLNPLKHIDPIGTLLVPALLIAFTGFIFGWAKPVPVDIRQLKNPRWDSALVAAAGPISNLIMALCWAGLLKICLLFLGGNGEIPNYFIWLLLMSKAGITINLFLAVLNLIPIPPLDGSRVVSSLLPAHASFYYNRLEPFGFIILLALIALNWLYPLIMPLFSALEALILYLFQF